MRDLWLLSDHWCPFSNRETIFGWNCRLKCWTFNLTVDSPGINLFSTSNKNIRQVWSAGSGVYVHCITQPWFNVLTDTGPCFLLIIKRRVLKYDPFSHDLRVKPLLIEITKNLGIYLAFLIKTHLLLENSVLRFRINGPESKKYTVYQLSIIYNSYFRICHKHYQEG